MSRHKHADSTAIVVNRTNDFRRLGILVGAPASRRPGAVMDWGKPLRLNRRSGRGSGVPALGCVGFGGRIPDPDRQDANCIAGFHNTHRHGVCDTLPVSSRSDNAFSPAACLSQDYNRSVVGRPPNCRQSTRWIGCRPARLPWPRKRHHRGALVCRRLGHGRLRFS